jgi:predicted metalloprotease with PDZ domain
LCNNVVGQLGADFIYQHNWKIDFEKKEITISELPFESDGIKISFADFPNKYFIKCFSVQLFNNANNFIIDFGNSDGITLSFDDLNQNKEQAQGLKCIPSFTTVRSVNSSVQMNALLSQVDVLIDEKKFSDQLLYFRESNRRDIGIDFFMNYNTIINSASNTFILKDNKIPKKKLNEIKDFGLGLSVIFLEKKWTVQSLKQNSPADKAGIKINDLIVSINGNKISDFGSDYCSFSEFSLDIHEKEEMDLIIIRDGREIKFVLKKSASEVIDINSVIN